MAGRLASRLGRRRLSMHQAEAGRVPALETFPERDARAARAVGRPRRLWWRLPRALTRFFDELVDVTAAARVVLDVTVEERGDEMQADADEAILAPDGIFEPVLVPQVLLHRGRHWPEA